MSPIVVKGRGDKITARHKKHAEEKFRKLSRYFNGIVKMEAVLQNGSGEARAELLISVKGGKTLVSQTRSKELYAAIDLLLDKAEVQLTRYKEKLRTHKGSGHQSAAVLADEAGALGKLEEDPEEEGYEDIVQRRTM